MIVRLPRNGLAAVALLLALVAASGCSRSIGQPAIGVVAAATLPAGGGEPPPARPQTLGFAADAALATLETRLYRAPGRWTMCVPDTCGTSVRDWGADALTYTLALRWKLNGDRSIPPIVAALAAAAPDYRPCRTPGCLSWSDVPMWDAIAAVREFEIGGDPRALDRARHAFASVDESADFAQGACPTLNFQRPHGGKTALKTLETDSNYIKAALLLAHWTGDRRFVDRAVRKYAAVRRYFLDRQLPLYTVYVFDDGRRCTQLPGRFFASVNGNMIASGLALARQTGRPAYRREALETAAAVARRLNDGAGLFANLQAENDVAEPLVEAMSELAQSEHQAFARRWLLRNAAVAVPAPSGAYGRFFGGPAPAGAISAWAANGGLALAIAAGALDRDAPLIARDIWPGAHVVATTVAQAPATIAFSGRAIALLGTIGERCCEAGHVRVLIDGRETVDTTGIWQNKSPGSHPLPDSILLSWRWSGAGRHTIAFEPGAFNAKEGGSYIHVSGYEFVP